MLNPNAAEAILGDKRPMVIWEGLIEAGHFRVVVNAASHLIVEVLSTKDAMGQSGWQTVAYPEKKVEILEEVAKSLLMALHEKTHLEPTEDKII